MSDPTRTRLAAIQRRIPPLPDADLSMHERDRRWLVGVVEELQAALEITGQCRCTVGYRPAGVRGFQCSRCKALALLTQPDEGTP